MRSIQMVLFFVICNRPLRLFMLCGLAVLSLTACFGSASKERSAAGMDDGANMLLLAARVFDGNDLRNNAGVLIAGSKVVAVGTAEELRGRAGREIDLGDSTILPGFIELHGHVVFRNIPRDKVLRHGITTVRDVGGPLQPVSGGNGRLRLLTAGPIITVPGGYPIPVFGHSDVAAQVQSSDEARQLVRTLVEGGAVVIKIALEPGGETGAPWTLGHKPMTLPPWPMPSPEIVNAIVAEAHRLGKRVSAHVGEKQGMALALAAGIDELAHVPCSPIGEDQLRWAVQQGIKVVTTLDALSQCSGAYSNAMSLARLGAQFLYGAEIAHTDIPWGIDAQELHLMAHLTGMSPLDLFRMATAKAGKYLGLSPLGALTPGAPADIIAVRGNPFENFKLLEYPDIVISGGRLIVNEYKN